MATRIKRAGGDPIRLFTREAVHHIHTYAGGIPRTVNVICDNALLAGMAAQRQPIDSELVLEVCRDFDLSAATHEDTALIANTPALAPIHEPMDSAESEPTTTRRRSMFRHAAARGFALLDPRR